MQNSCKLVLHGNRHEHDAVREQSTDFIFHDSETSLVAFQFELAALDSDAVDAE